MVEFAENLFWAPELSNPAGPSNFVTSGMACLLVVIAWSLNSVWEIMTLFCPLSLAVYGHNTTINAYDKSFFCDVCGTQFVVASLARYCEEKHRDTYTERKATDEDVQ